jgi:hypothetical protein
MSPCRACRGKSAKPRPSRRGGGYARTLRPCCRNATKNTYATGGTRDITNQITQLLCEAPLMGVLALATHTVPADRSHLSEGQSE